MCAPKETVSSLSVRVNSIFTMYDYNRTLNLQVSSPCLIDFSSFTSTGFPKADSKSSLIQPREQLHHVGDSFSGYSFTIGQ